MSSISIPLVIDIDICSFYSRMAAFLQRCVHVVFDLVLQFPQLNDFTFHSYNCGSTPLPPLCLHHFIRDHIFPIREFSSLLSLSLSHPLPSWTKTSTTLPPWQPNLSVLCLMAEVSKILDPRRKSIPVTPPPPPFCSTVWLYVNVCFISSLPRFTLLLFLLNLGRLLDPSAGIARVVNYWGSTLL